MPIAALILVALAIGVAIIWLGWRYSARVTSAPCPAMFAWALDLNLGTNKTLRELDLAPGLHVADVGCGPGRLTVPIALEVGPGGEVAALDMQKKMLDKLARRCAEKGVANVRPVHGGAGKGLLPKGHFDRALLVTVLGEIPDRESALREIYAALKPGGYLLISEVLGDPHYQTIARVRSLAAHCGFRFECLRSGLFSYSARLYRPG